MQHYAAEPAALRPAHAIRVLEDGRETFPAMLEAVARARCFIHLETYIFEDGEVGRAFATALRERSRAKVAVRLLVDGFGSLSLAETFMTALEHDGVEVATYRPLLDEAPGKAWLRRDHRKVLVVDGEVAFVGGINIGDDYAPPEQGGGGWRDTHARIRGPVVGDLEAMFRDSWIEAGGEAYTAYPIDSSEVAIGPDSELAVVVASGRARRSVIRRHVLFAIERATESVWISNAYFIPDRELCRSLIGAARRGVDVRVIVPEQSDVKAAQWAGEATYAKLLDGGVRIHPFLSTHMHAKTMVVDGVWSAIGSHNFDYVSLFLNRELIIEVVGRRTGAAMRAMFERDLARCVELDPKTWKARPAIERWVQRFAYRFRRWL